MYTVEERPTVEFQLGQYNDIYSTNIESLLNILHMDRVIFRDLEGTLSKWGDFVQKQIDFFPKKEFYVPESLYKLIRPLNNCNEYSSFKYGDKKEAYSDLLFLDIDLDMENLDSYFDELKKLIKGKEKTCIVFFDCKRKIKGEKIQMVLEKLIGLSNECEILLSNQFISAQSIIQHPCNAYLCSGNKCHSGKSPYPRFLHVSENGIFPYGCKNEALVFCKKISFENIKDFSGEFSKYLCSEEYQTFLNANKRIYRRYIVFSHFVVLPWNVFLEKVL